MLFNFLLLCRAKDDALDRDFVMKTPNVSDRHRTGFQEILATRCRHTKPGKVRASPVWGCGKKIHQLFRASETGSKDRQDLAARFGGWHAALVISL